jgi:hypothetical protein
MEQVRQALKKLNVLAQNADVNCLSQGMRR